MKAVLVLLALAVTTPLPVAALDIGTLETKPLDDRPGPVVVLLAKVIPTVVAIHTRRSLASAHDDPSKAGYSPKIQRAEGSGFIVSADGYIATNKHVVHGAYDVTVSLHDGYVTEAHIVWESTVVDVAFLKIDTDHPLQPAMLARDNALQIGRRVVAIGNPQGLGISASAGIVSALDRDLKQSPYDNYIQTDAAINYGNSGGPLFDLDGEVVGMNSILWTTGKDQGSQGLNFAIPGGDIFFLIEQLKRNKRIECGTLGLHAQKLTAAMGEALGFPGPYGVIVASVEAESAAAEAGLRSGDVIQTFDGKTLNDVTTLNRTTCLALGHPAKVAIWRDGHAMSLEAHVKKAYDGTPGSVGGETQKAPRFASARDLGLVLAPADDATRRRYRMRTKEQGFVVVSVADSSEAGDVIVSLQMTPLSDATPFDQTFASYGRKGHRHVIALVHSNGGERWITLPVRLTGAP